MSVQERRKLFEGIANITTKTVRDLSRHTDAKRSPNKHGGTYFVKSLGHMKNPIIFRFYQELDDGSPRTCESGAFTGACFILMIERKHENGQVFTTVDISKRPDEITDFFVEVIQGGSEYRHSATSEVINGLDKAGCISVQIVQK